MKMGVYMQKEFYSAGTTPVLTSSDDRVAKAASVESWWRTQSATMALLKHAHSMIDDAEKRLAEQEKKIRQLEALASTDMLTCLMNRRGFENFFEQEQERIRRGTSTGGLLILIDLDRFKEINDSHGHQAGDACLKAVANELARFVRVVDGAARFGGDEFAILLTNTDAEKASARLQSLHTLLNNLHLEWNGHRLYFGASLGVEEVKSGVTYAAAYNTADANLYADKKKRKAQRAAIQQKEKINA